MAIMICDALGNLVRFLYNLRTKTCLLQFVNFFLQFEGIKDV